MNNIIVPRIIKSIRDFILWKYRSPVMDYNELCNRLYLDV